VLGVCEVAHGRERERVSQRERGKERGGFVASKGVSRRSPRWSGHKQEVASAAPGSSTQLLHEEDKPTFAKIPLAFGVFLGILKTTQVLV
jgi:hypothetical protein